MAKDNKTLFPPEAFAPCSVVESAHGYPVLLITPTEDGSAWRTCILSGIQCGNEGAALVGQPSYRPLSAEGAARLAWDKLQDPSYVAILQKAVAEIGQTVPLPVPAPAPVVVSPPAPEGPIPAAAPAEVERSKRGRKKREAVVVVGAPTPAAVETVPEVPALTLPAQIGAVSSPEPTASVPAAAPDDIVDVSSPRVQQRSPPLRFITEIEADIKDMPKKVVLGRLTYVVGPSGAGKTALQQAATLLLDGSADDIQGREDVREVHRLVRALAVDGEQFRVRGRMSDGSQGSYTASGGTKKHSPPAEKCELPYRRTRAALTGDEEVARRFLIRASYTDLTVKDVAARMSEPLRSTLADLYSEALSDGSRKRTEDDKDVLLRLNKFTKKRLDGLSSSLATKRLELAQMQSQINRQSTVDTGRVASIRQQIAECEQWLTQSALGLSTACARRDAMQAHLSAVNTMLSVTVRLGQLGDEAQVIVGERREIEGLWERVQRALFGTMPQDVLQAGVVLEQHMHASTAETELCLGCGTRKTLMERADWHTTYRNWHGSYVTALAGTIARRDELLRRNNDLRHRTEKNTWEQQQQQQNMGEAQRHLQPGLETATQATLDQTIADITKAETDIRNVRETASNLAGQVAGMANQPDLGSQFLQGQTKAVEDLETWVTRINTVLKELEAVFDTLVQTAAASFTERVSGYLPNNQRFAIDLRNAEVGIVRTEKSPGDRTPLDRFITGLCGRDWTRVLVALAAATVPVDAEAALIVLPDRDMDPIARRETMVALSDCPAQVIMTGTSMPHRGLPKGWTLVDLREDGSIE